MSVQLACYVSGFFFVMSSYSSPAMESLQIMSSSLGKKVSQDRDSGDKALDFIKAQQRTAYVETIDMMASHGHIRQAVRDYAHGLLSAASQQKKSIKQDHFAVVPCSMGKVDDEWIAGYLVKATKLSWGDLSQCRAFDPKFAQKFWLLIMNSMAGTKLPLECARKPVLASMADLRIKELGDVFADLSKETPGVMKDGKVNWGRVGFFQATVNAENIIADITHVYSKQTVDISAENITSDFSFDNNWNPRAAVLSKGSRKHTIMDFFSKEQQAKMQPWSGSCRPLADSARAVAGKIDEAASSGQVKINREELMQGTHDKRVAAMAAAKDKLMLAKQETAKKRRMLSSVLDKPDQLDHHLYRYVQSGREATNGHCHLSYCHDKGNVAGLQMQPGAFFTSQNVGIVACPTVPTSIVVTSTAQIDQLSLPWKKSVFFFPRAQVVYTKNTELCVYTTHKTSGVYTKHRTYVYTTYNFAKNHVVYTHCTGKLIYTTHKPGGVYQKHRAVTIHHPTHFSEFPHFGSGNYLGAIA